MEAWVYAVRGAITVDENTREAIIESTKELILEVCRENYITDKSQVISVVFTSTSDLTAEFPAKAARTIGWTSVPLICARELEIEGSMKSCIRLLMHFYSNVKNQEIKHIYLKDAKKLRPDLGE